MDNVLCIFLLIIVTIAMLYTAFQDPDFKGHLYVTKKDKVSLTIFLILFTIILVHMPLYPKIYVSIALPILLVSAFTDKQTKLLYNSVFYILAALSLILETLQASTTTFNYQTLFHFDLSMKTLSIILFVLIMDVFQMYGNGDKGMAVVCGCAWYLFHPEGGITGCMLAECIMLTIAECTFYVKAIKEKNLAGPFRLKESRPLGPDLLVATTIVLLGGSLIWGS